MVGPPLSRQQFNQISDEVSGYSLRLWAEVARIRACFKAASILGQTLSSPTIAAKPACSMTARGCSRAPQKIAARPESRSRERDVFERAESGGVDGRHVPQAEDHHGG